MKTKKTPPKKEPKATNTPENELIADFMNGRRGWGDTADLWYFPNSSGIGIPVKYLIYDASWDALMPVLNKIGSMPKTSLIVEVAGDQSATLISVNGELGAGHFNGPTIKTAHMSVVKFLKECYPSQVRECRLCNGEGTIMYGSTSTWRGGIGGAAMTEDTCEKCWGSGDEHHPNPSLRTKDNDSTHSD